VRRRALSHIRAKNTHLTRQHVGEHFEKHRERKLSKRNDPATN
jgi:hypothetical protein